MIHIADDNNIILSKDIPIFILFLATIKFNS